MGELAQLVRGSSDRNAGAIKAVAGEARANSQSIRARMEETRKDAQEQRAAKGFLTQEERLANQEGRLQRQEGRAEDTHEKDMLLKENQFIHGNQQTKMNDQSIKGTAEEMTAAQRKRKIDTVNASYGAPYNAILQAIALDDAFVGGNLKADIERDRVVTGLLDDPNMKAMVAANPTFSVMANMSSDQYRKLSVEDKGEVFTALRFLDKSYKDLKQKEADTAYNQKIARETQGKGDLAYAESFGKQKGENDANKGQPLEMSAAAQTNQRELAGQTMMQAFSDSNFKTSKLDDLGINKAMFKDMDHRTFSAESELFNGLMSGIVTGDGLDIDGKHYPLDTNTQKNALISDLRTAYQGANMLEDSPFSHLLAWLEGDTPKEIRNSFKNTSYNKKTSTPKGMQKARPSSIGAGQ